MTLGFIGPNRSDFFALETVNDRPFKDLHDSHLFEHIRPIAKLLFRIDPSDTKTLHEAVHDKVIFVLGGGESLEDLLKNHYLNPKLLLNIDPHVVAESTWKGERGVYASLNASAADTELIEKLREAGMPPQADEIWASYSVPLYLETAQEIKDFLRNMYTLLKVGGIARIYPLCFGVMSDEQPLLGDPLSKREVFHFDPPEERTDAFVSVLRDLAMEGRVRFTADDWLLIMQKIQ